MIADQLAEALRELKREAIDDPQIAVNLYDYLATGRPTTLPELRISPRTERLVANALRAHDGNST